MREDKDEEEEGRGKDGWGGCVCVCLRGGENELIVEEEDFRESKMKK